jgi:acyl dehydratase
MTITAHGLGELKALAGTSLGHTGWLEITQERVNAFADATDDHQWIHVDSERAKEGPFGSTIAHGYLTLSLLPAASYEVIPRQGGAMSINYGLNKVRFPAPVPVGSKIRMTAQLGAAEAHGVDAVQAVVDFTIEVEGSDKPACVAQGVYRYYA